MIKFFKWLFSKFGYVLITDAELDAFNSKIAYQHSHIDELTADRDRYRQLAKELRLRVDSVDFQTMEQWKKQIDEQAVEMSRQREANAELDAKVEKSLAFYRTVEKRLSETLHTTDEFGFPSAQTFPGSVCGQAATISKTDKTEYVVVDGRGTIPLDVFDAIKAEPFVGRRYALALSCLGQYGMFDTILRSIMSNGGVEFSLGYNGDNQTYELYYRVLCRIPDADMAITIRPTATGRYILDDGEEKEG